VQGDSPDPSEGGFRILIKTNKAVREQGRVGAHLADLVQPLLDISTLYDGAGIEIDMTEFEPPTEPESPLQQPAKHAAAERLCPVDEALWHRQLEPPREPYYTVRRGEPSMVLLGEVAVFLTGLVGRELKRAADQVLDAAIDWVKRHRLRGERVDVVIYGPDGRPLKRVRVRPRQEVNRGP